MPFEEMIKDKQQNRARIINAAVASANNEAKQILAEAQAEAQKERAKLEADTDKSVEMIRSRARSSARLKGQRAYLSAKRDILLDAHDQTLANLGGLSPEAKAPIYKALLDSIPKAILPCKIYVKQGEEAAVKAMLAGRKGVAFGGAHSGITAGGVIVESDAEMVKLDYRFETLFEDLWAESQREVEGLLFE